MNPFDQLLTWLDPWLVAPFRWLDDPVWAWWLGALVLAFQATILGELTLALIYRINARQIKTTAEEMIKRHNQSLQALTAGDKRAYKGLNKLANEAFGKAFFMQIAMGSSSLWPAFLAAGWLALRFSQTDIPIPWTGISLGYVGAFLICYLLSRIIFGRLKPRLPLFRRTLALARSLTPSERMEFLGVPEAKADATTKRR